MPRGRKKRVLQCHPPPKGYYTVDWVVNDLVSLNALSRPAVSLWLHLKGLAWERGECDPTDERLAELMGGVTAEMVRITRRELRSKHLLLEYQKPASTIRWLIPLPVLSGQRGSLPSMIIEAVAAGEAQLRQMLAQFRTPQAEPHPGSNGNSPQAEFGANSICSKLALKEEAEGEYPGKFYLPPSERVNAIARGSREGGAGGGRIYPKQDLGQIQFGAAEAKVYALAHLRAVQGGENPRGQRLQGEQAIGRWVARLREHARTPDWALDQAARELEPCDDAGEEVPDEDNLEADDEAADNLSGEDETEVEEGDHDAEAAEEIACISLNGQPATPSAVWEATKAQLRYQMVHGAYDNWIADTVSIGVENDPDRVGTGQTLVVQVANPYAVQWLDLRLKRLVLRTLQGLVGNQIGVRFQVDGKTAAS